MQRIKASEVKTYRQHYLQEQQNICALCKELIDPAEAVLDHCHTTGKLRAVLHRGCNAYLGVLENNRRRNRISDSRLANIFANAVAYMSDTKDVLHPTHRTPEERAERTKRRAKLRRERAKKAKAEKM